jgi:protein SCO1/2
VNNSFKFLLAFLFFSFSFIIADEKKIEIGIDEQLGKAIPLDVNFKDENGNTVSLKQLINKPTVVTFVYYNCPGICSPLLMELGDIVNKSDLKLGKDYEIVSISMDQFETPKTAKERKQAFIQVLNGPADETAWHFLTGDSADIRKLSDAAGFYFKRSGKDFLHSGAFIFVSSEGKICRYLFPSFSERSGFGILPFDFKMAVLETSEGKTVPTIAKVLQFCFRYNPDGQTYVLNFTRIFGVIILLLAGAFAFFVILKPKKENRNTR